MLFPLIVSEPAPGPVMVRSLDISSCPLVSVIVPLSPGAKVIVFEPPAVLLMTMSFRSEPAPESFRLATMNVLSSTRPSSPSTMLGTGASTAWAAGARSREDRERRLRRNISFSLQVRPRASPV